MKGLTTEITLQTTRNRVWELLTDFALYPQWNPLLTKLEGAGTSGAWHVLVVHLPGIDPFTARKCLLTVEENRVSWRCQLVAARLLDWTLRFEIEALSPERLKFVQRSEFSGALAPIFSFALNKPLADGMEQLSQAVRRWGEKGNVSCLKC